MAEEIQEASQKAPLEPEMTLTGEQHDVDDAERKPTSFLDLAAELRNRIYEEALSVSTPGDRLCLSRFVSPDGDERWTVSEGSGSALTPCAALNLLRVCKQVRSEAMPVFWYMKYFSGSDYSHTLSTVKQMSAGLARLGLSQGMVVRDLKLRTSITREVYDRYTISLTSVPEDGKTSMKIAAGGENRRYRITTSEQYRHEQTLMSIYQWVDEAAQLAKDVGELTGVDVSFWVTSGMAEARSNPMSTQASYRRYRYRYTLR